MIQTDIQSINKIYIDIYDGHVECKRKILLRPRLSFQEFLLIF